MTVAQLVFYMFAALSVGSGLFMLFSKNVLHSVLSLLALFIGVSAMYVYAGADFLAITQLVVYIGGILVLLLFGVMLTNRQPNDAYPVSKSRGLGLGIAISIVVFGLLAYVLLQNKNVFIHVPVIDNSSPMKSSTQIIGVGLMSEYVLVFELAGILLLVALIGAAFIAGKKEGENQ